MLKVKLETIKRVEKKSRVRKLNYAMLQALMSIFIDNIIICNKTKFVK